MKTPLLIAKLTPLVIFAMVAVVAVAYAHGGLPDPASAQDSPAVGIGLSPSGSVDEGDAITVTMSFGNLESDDDRATTDYIFRADVVGADQCEDQAGGYGLGVDRKINLVDEDPEVRRGGISADCPAGDYTLRASISDANGAELASATAAFSVAAPEPPPSTDASLSSLTLSGVTLEFDPATTTYAAEVGNDVAESTVTPAVNHAGATYVVRLDGTADGNGVIPLAVGENVITVEVTAEDGETTRTYTVTVARAEPPTSDPTVAIALSPSDTMIEGEGDEIAVTMSFGNLTFDSDQTTTDYTFRADVKDSENGDADECEEQAGGYGLGVDRKINLVDEDPETRDGTISADCPEGAYTLRASLSADGVELASASATFSVATPDSNPPPPPTVSLALFSQITQGEEAQFTMAFGGLEFDSDTSDVDYIFRADVLNSENADADGCEGGGMGLDHYIYQVDEILEVRNASISADCPAGDYTVRTSIATPANVELAAVSANFSVPAPEEVPVSSEQSVAGRNITLHTDNGAPKGVWSNGTTVWVADSGDDKLYAYTLSSGTRDTGKEFSLHSDNGSAVGIWSNGATIWVADSVDRKFYAYTLAGGVRDSGKDFNMASQSIVVRDIWSNGTTIWVADSNGDKLYAHTLSSGTRDTNKEFNLHSDNGSPWGIWSDGATIWVADNFDGKVYAYTLASGARDTGKDFDLDTDNGAPKGIWSNGSLMWVADSGDDKLYAYDLPVNDDATLSDLTVSPANLIWFDSETATYHYRVADGVTQVTITPTANDAGATIDIGGTAVTSGTGHQVALNPDGVTPTDVTVTVTAEDGRTTKDYTVRVTWAASSDATLRGLTLSGINFGFNPATESYTLGGNEGVSLSSTTVTPTVNSPAARYSINGVPLNTAGKLNLAFGANTITIVVTAADDSTKTYTVTVNRKAPPPGTPLLKELKLVYQPFVEDTFIGICPVTINSGGSSTCFGPAGVWHTEFDVDTGTVDVVTVVANPRSEDATVAFNYPDFDPDKGGHQVKLAGEGTSPTILVTVENPQGTSTAYKINVIRQLSGDTRLGELSVTKSGGGEFIMYESLYPSQPNSNLEPEFITEWNEATGQPRRARYRATLLFNERDGTAENAVVRVVGQPLHTGAAVRIHGESSDTSPFLHVFRFTVDDTGEQQALRVELDVQAENGDIHVYELVIVKRYLQGSSPPALAKVFKGVNEWDQKPSLFVDWRDGQSCTKPYNVATEYITDTHQGWLSHPVTNEREFLDEGQEEYTHPQRTHRWLDSDSLEAAFGPATAERRDTTIEVWCGPRPYTYKDEDGNDQQANKDSRLVGTATIEFPDAPPAPPEPTVAPETPTGLAGRLIVHRAELTWNTVAGATRYELSIWDGEAWIDSNHDIFTDPDRSSLTAEIGDGEATVSPLYESSHQFRVRAVNDIGSSGWSEAVTVED